MLKQCWSHLLLARVTHSEWTEDQEGYMKNYLLPHAPAWMLRKLGGSSREVLLCVLPLPEVWMMVICDPTVLELPAQRETWYLNAYLPGVVPRGEDGRHSPHPPKHGVCPATHSLLVWSILLFLFQKSIIWASHWFVILDLNYFFIFRLICCSCLPCFFFYGCCGFIVISFHEFDILKHCFEIDCSLHYELKSDIEMFTVNKTMKNRFLHMVHLSLRYLWEYSTGKSIEKSTGKQSINASNKYYILFGIHGRCHTLGVHFNWVYKAEFSGGFQSPWCW